MKEKQDYFLPLFLQQALPPERAYFFSVQEKNISCYKKKKSFYRAFCSSPSPQSARSQPAPQATARAPPPPTQMATWTVMGEGRGGVVFRSHKLMRP